MLIGNGNFNMGILSQTFNIRNLSLGKKIFCFSHSNINLIRMWKLKIKVEQKFCLLNAFDSVSLKTNQITTINISSLERNGKSWAEQRKNLFDFNLNISDGNSKVIWNVKMNEISMENISTNIFQLNLFQLSFGRLSLIKMKIFNAHLSFCQNLFETTNSITTHPFHSIFLVLIKNIQTELN